MPVPPFNGDTFVAFIDISGFKSMMKDGQRAVLALDAFYRSGYSVLNEYRHERPNQQSNVHGFFISDCAVLFVTDPQESTVIRFEAICRILQQIHKRTFQNAVQLTTAIAWGPFDYHERIEFIGLNKDPIYGNAYVDAFIDNESGEPKLYPNECRLLRKGLPPDVEEFCLGRLGLIGRHIRETPTHFYFEWMREE